MTKILIPSSIEQIENGKYFNDDWKYNTGVFENSGLEKVIFEEGIKYVGNRAFRNCTKLTSISLPDSILDIGSEVFYNCTSLQQVNLSKTLNSVGSFSFL